MIITLQLFENYPEITVLESIVSLEVSEDNVSLLRIDDILIEIDKDKISSLRVE